MCVCVCVLRAHTFWSLVISTSDLSNSDLPRLVSPNGSKALIIEVLLDLHDMLMATHHLRRSTEDRNQKIRF